MVFALPSRLRLTPLACACLLAGLTACNDNQTSQTYVAPTAPTGLGYAASADSNPTAAPYIDNGASNQRGKACMATLETNAGVRVVAGFLDIWEPRTRLVDAGVTAPADGSCPAVTSSDWSGLPGSATDGTVKNPSVHAYNIHYVEQLTANRTPAQELAAYLDDRRGKNYSVSDGMGPLTDAWRAGSKQTTTITDIPADATSVKYDDKGNNRGLGSDSNADMGLAVDFINALSVDGSTEPAKRFFKYARPWRWSSAVKVVPALEPAKSSTPNTDGGFISGHSAEGVRDSLAMAYLVPERYQEMLARGLELGENRILAGMHSPLDVIGGRMQALAVVAYNLHRSEVSSLKQSAYTQTHHWLNQQLGLSDDNALWQVAHSGSQDRFADHAQIKADYLRRLTFGFTPIAATDKPAMVPKGAEILLETRLPYLSDEQRRVVLQSTALPSGYPLMDDAEGWGRLNLFAAADGYGRFDGDVDLLMDAAEGGFHASDRWRNDIGGAGKLTKRGSGSLLLSGHNSWTGGTDLQEGTLQASSSSALGAGDLYQRGGTLQVNSALQIGGHYTQQAGAILHSVLGNDGAGRLTIKGDAVLAGELQVTLQAGYQPTVGDTLQLLRCGTLHGAFSKVTLAGYTVTPLYSANGVQLRIDGRPS